VRGGFGGTNRNGERINDIDIQGTVRPVLLDRTRGDDHDRTLVANRFELIP